MPNQSAKIDQQIKFSRITPRLLIVTAFLLAIIFLAIIIIGIRENQNNMLRMLRREGGALVEAIFISSQNAIRANALVDDIVTDNLVDAATLIDLDLEMGDINPDRLNQICNLLGFNRIDIVDSTGIIAMSNYSNIIGKGYDAEFLQRLPLSEIIRGAAGVGTFVLSDTDVYTSDQLVAAISRETAPGAIVIFMNYQKLDNFYRRIGIGYMIQNIGNQPGIEYIFLQTSDGVAISSRKIEPVLAIEADTFLQQVINNNREDSRKFTFEDKQVLEIARPFFSQQFPPGVLRVGMSLDGFHQVSRNFKTQMAVMGGILFLLTFLFVTMVMANQNYRSVAVAYEQFKNITSNILGGIESAVLAVDQRGKIIMINPKTERMFNVRAAKCIGRHYHEIFPDDIFMIEDLKASGQDALVREQTYRRHPDKELTLLVTSSDLVDKSGAEQGIVGIAHDITARKKLELQAKQAERLSELGTLAAGVAHEIRNPLNAIAIAAQRLKSEYDVKEDKEGFEELASTIRSEIERLNSIIVEFLALARSGQLKKERVDLKAFISEIVGLFENEAAQNDIALEAELSDEIIVSIDVQEMKKVLGNLIKNALEAAGKNGRIVIKSSMVDGRAEISIEDSGHGIDPDKINDIFTPYFTTKEHGTGLGLSISHRIVSDHGGNISAENTADGGARFTISIPAES